jgi:hypothetical protein
MILSKPRNAFGVGGTVDSNNNVFICGQYYDAANGKYKFFFGKMSYLLVLSNFYYYGDPNGYAYVGDCAMTADSRYMVATLATNGGYRPAVYGTTTYINPTNYWYGTSDSSVPFWTWGGCCCGCCCGCSISPYFE